MVVQRATFCNTWRDIFHSNRQRRVLSLYYIAVVVVSFFFGQITAFCKFFKCQNPLGSDRNTSLSTEKVNESEGRLFSNRGGGDLKRTR